MKKLMDILAILLVVVFLAAGCAPVISKGLRAQVDKEIRFEEVIQNPEAYQGKVVVWGGVIIAAKNLKEGTLIEVLQKPTDIGRRPKDIDHSEGRFLALYDGYLPARHRSHHAGIARLSRGERAQPRRAGMCLFTPGEEK